MSSFVISFLTEKHGGTEAAFEWSYNLQEAVTSFDFDAGLKLFAGVLADEVRIPLTKLSSHLSLRNPFL